LRGDSQEGRRRGTIPAKKLLELVRLLLEDEIKFMLLEIQGRLRAVAKLIQILGEKF
jgi:hypothetical protein